MKANKKTVRPPVIRTYFGRAIDPSEVIADNFAGGGGASLGELLATGRAPDIAVNHDPEAIAMHAANHPETKHYTEDVYRVDPVEACGGRSVALAWFSPDCKHHSKAKGGTPRDSRIRGLAWVAVRWAAAVKPRVILLENVEEFQSWGPLHRKHTHGCAGSSRGCRKGCSFARPIKERAGETFAAFVRRLTKLGYVVEWKLLRACDYGAPTSRRRLILVARCDGFPITWPTPTHGPGRLMPHRTAAEVIDWQIPAPSIFGRAKPLADKTLARIARGVRKFVLETARPFIVPTAHGGVGRTDHRVHSLDEPLRTVTGGRRGDHALVVPYMVHVSNGERKGQAPRIYDIEKPLGTVVAQGQKHALCAALLIKNYGTRHENEVQASDVAAPIGTVTTQDHHSLAVVHLTKFYGTSTGSDMREPVPTVTSSGQHLGAVSAMLVRYNGKSEAQSADKPIGTLTAKDRYALVTVTIDGEPYALVDIGMRMLTPRELYRAQGFPEHYKIDIPYRGKRLSKTAQVRMCGNSVCPPLAAAVVRAQFQLDNFNTTEAAAA